MTERVKQKTSTRRQLKQKDRKIALIKLAK